MGIHNDEVVYVPIDRAIKKDKPIDHELINILAVLSFVKFEVPQRQPLARNITGIIRDSGERFEPFVSSLNYDDYLSDSGSSSKSSPFISLSKSDWKRRS